MIRITNTPRITFITIRGARTEGCEHFYRPWKSAIAGRVLLTCFIAFDVALADASRLRPVDSIELKIGGVPPTEATSESGLYRIDGRQEAKNSRIQGRLNSLLLGS